MDKNELHGKVTSLVDEAFELGRKAERDRIASVITGDNTGTFTAPLRRGPKPKSFKFLAPTISQHRNRRGNGGRAYDAYKVYIEKLPDGAVVRSRDLARIPPKVSSFTVYQNVAKLLREGYIETTPTRGSYIKVKR